MNKKVFTFLIILSLGIIPFTSAREISQQEAKKVAKNFFFELKSNAHLNYDQMIIAESFTTEKNGEIVYYAFNFQNGGFVIVAADDTYSPIIGYSDKNTFREEGAPENVEAWMNNYAEDIIAVKQRKEPSKFLDQWNHLLTNDQNILSRGAREDVVFLDCAIWNQDGPFNYYAPQTPDGSGPDGKCYAGCVSTAMEMCMNYWRWPLSGEGSNSYQSHSYGYDPNCATPHQTWNWGTLSADFANSTYNWYNTAHDPGAKFFDGISYLMYHCGVSVEMTYDPCGSGAQSADAAVALKNNFKYATNTAFQQRGNATTWINLIKEELNNGRMVYYSGTSPTGGHAFVCDGYDNNNMFHFNFGWSGTENGYYSIQTGPNQYTQYQGMIKNLQPNPNKGYPYYCEGHTDIPLLKGSVEDGSGPLMNYLDNTSASWLIDPSLVGDSTSSMTITWRKLHLGNGDYVNFYDGTDANAPLIRSFTANSLPESITATSGRVFVTFTSDNEGTDDGFHFEFNSIGKKYCTGNNFINDYSGTITDGSPDDMNYADGTSCIYIFNNNKDLDWINFRFTRCHLGAGDCIYFRLENTVTDTIIGIYDIDLPELLFENISNSRVSFTFAADSKINETGWEIEYTTNKTAIEEFEAVTNLAVYPNPANNVVKVNFQTETTNNMEINLYSITGQSLYTTSYNNFSGNFNTSIDVSQFPQGVYLLNIRTDKGISTRKVIVQ